MRIVLDEDEKCCLGKEEERKETRWNFGMEFGRNITRLDAPREKLAHTCPWAFF